MLRIVSLVPSWTETLFSLGAGERVVGCTRYCVEPPEGVRGLPKVGGTKDVDLAAVIELRPDLVIANREENPRRAIEALQARGVSVLLTFAQSVREAVSELREVGRASGTEEAAENWARRIEREIEEAEAAARARRSLRVAALVWRDPWMAAGPQTYIDDLLRLCGAENVFSDRRRRYPLAADLGSGPAHEPGERDTRYPRFSLEELRARSAELVLLPDEPYAFAEQDATELRAHLPGVLVEPCSGKDLCWYGVRMAEAIPRVARLLSEARARIDR